ncbi:MAG: hypothetical protein EXS03_07740 [Phycisphaerales bacterium]|nr:hypothetical protein [Phycisphaerales bacterium]
MPQRLDKIHRSSLRTAGCAALVASLFGAIAMASTPEQSSGDTKKPKGSWKIPPSVPAKSPPGAPGSTPESAPESAPATPEPAASTSPLGEVARLARMQSAIGGADGPWNQSIHVFLGSPTSGIVPAVRFTGTSSPSVVPTGDGAVALFFVQYPLTDENSFATLAVARGTDGCLNWTSPVRTVFDSMPLSIEGPLNPSVVALPDGSLRVAFVGRDHTTSPLQSLLMTAHSADRGSSWQVDPSRLNLGPGEIDDLSCVQVGDTTHLLATIAGREGFAHASVSAGGAPLVSLKNIRFSAPGAWRGGCRLDGETIEFLGAPSQTTPPWRATNRAGFGTSGSWVIATKDAEAPALIPDDIAPLDLCRSAITGGDQLLTAVVLVRSASESPPPASDAPTTPIVTSEDGEAQEIAPVGRRHSDPVQGPTGLEARPLGGKRPTPGGTTPGPVAPPIGGKP